MSGPAHFSCSACGRKFAWKAELAGKKVRCKCGVPVAVPAGATATAAPAAKAVASNAIPVMPAVAAGASARPAVHASSSSSSSSSTQTVRPSPVSKIPTPPPARPTPAAAPDEPDLDALYALAGDDEKVQQAAAEMAGIRCPSCGEQAEVGAMVCLSCGMNFQTGKKLRTAIDTGDGGGKKKKGGGFFPGAAAAAPPAGGAQVVGYAGRNPRAAAAAAADQAEGVKALMWPIIFVGLGFVASMIYYMAGMKMSFGFATAYLAISTFVDMVLLFVACLVAIKLLDISLGSPAEAALKLCAVALVPSAVGGLISVSFDGGVFVGWAVSYGLYLALLMWFFDLDGTEVMLLSSIIWVIRTWAGMLVTGFLIAVLFGAVSMGGGGGGSGGGGGPASAVTKGFFGGSNLKLDSSPAGVENNRATVMLTRVGAEEVDKFLARSDKHMIRGFDNKTSREAVEALEEEGAIKIHVSDIREFPGGGPVIADKLVVELPADKELRAQLFEVHRKKLDELEVDWCIDHGPDQGYMILDFDGDQKY